MARGSGETVLVLEDDPAVRAVIVRSLEKLGYFTIEATDGDAALSILRENTDVAALLTDIVLPGSLNGAEVARAAGRNHPGLKVLFMSGYSQVDGDYPMPGESHMVKKPFRTSELAKKIRAVLDG